MNILIIFSFIKEQIYKQYSKQQYKLLFKKNILSIKKYFTYYRRFSD